MTPDHLSPADGADRLSGQRLLEFATGGLTWVLIGLPLWGPVLAPGPTAVLVVAFFLYVVYRGARLNVLGARFLYRIRSDLARDWLGEARLLPGWQDVRHMVVFPTYLEPTEVLIESLSSLERQDFPLDQAYVVLALEERDPSAAAKMRAVQRAFEGRFGRLLFTLHSLQPGETPGKSANLAWAVRQAQRELAASSALDPRHVVVTVCDADTELHPKHLSVLTHSVLTDRDASASVYQPLLQLNRGAGWHGALFGVLDALWTLNSVRGARGWPISTYSLLLDTCETVGYWDPDVIPEDCHMFFKLISSLPSMRLRSLPVPVAGDSVWRDGLGETLVARYRQARRWAWGISELPYLLRRLGPASGPACWSRLWLATAYLLDHLLWSIGWLLCSVGLVPWLWIAQEFRITPLAAQLAQVLYVLATVGPFTVAIVVALDWSLRSVAGRPVPGLRATVLALAAFPLASAVMWLAAVEANTRLVVGRPLAFEVAPKLSRDPWPAAESSDG